MLTVLHQTRRVFTVFVNVYKTYNEHNVVFENNKQVTISSVADLPFFSIQFPKRDRHNSCF